MHGIGAVGDRQRLEPAEEGRQPIAHAARHHARGDPLGAGDVAVHRQDEGARAPGGAVALAQQRIEQRHRLLLLAGDAERQRIAARGLVLRAPRHRRLVILLRELRRAEQVIGERAVRGIFAHRQPPRLGIGEQPQRLAGALELEEHRRAPGEEARILGIDRLGAREEGERRRGIPQPPAQLARGEQRAQVARIGGEHAHLAGEHVGIGIGRGDDLGLGKRGRKAGRGGGQGNRRPPQKC